jgi:hypothetical protein
MRKIYLLVLIMGCVWQLTICQTTNLVKNYTASVNLSNPQYAFDGNINTACTSSYYGTITIHVYLTKIATAAKVIFTSINKGYRIDLYSGTTLKKTGYYSTTSGSNISETIYIVDPSGFDRITVTRSNTSESLSIGEISITEMLLSDFSLAYAYDAGGNMTSRTLNFTATSQLKSAIIDTINEVVAEENKPKPIEDRFIATSVNVYPNPTKGNITISATNFESNTNFRMQLYSNSGVLIMGGKIEDGQTTVNISDKPAGTYYMNISVAGETHQWTIIKQ